MLVNRVECEYVDKVLENVWTIKDQYLTNILTIFVQCFCNVWQNLAKIHTLFGEYKDNVLTIFGQYQIFGSYLDNISTFFLENIWTMC